MSIKLESTPSTNPVLEAYSQTTGLLVESEISFTEVTPGWYEADLTVDYPEDIYTLYIKDTSGGELIAPLTSYVWDGQSEVTDRKILDNLKAWAYGDADLNKTTATTSFKNDDGDVVIQIQTLDNNDNPSIAGNTKRRNV